MLNFIFLLDIHIHFICLFYKFSIDILLFINISCMNQANYTINKEGFLGKG
jgi:hypothetical protein